MRFKPTAPGPAFDALCRDVVQADLLVFLSMLWATVNLHDSRIRTPEMRQVSWLIDRVNTVFAERGFDSPLDVMAALEVRFPRELDEALHALGMAGVVFVEPGTAPEEAVMDEIMRRGALDAGAAHTTRAILGRLQKGN